MVTRPAGRRIVFACLYLSEGAPIGFIWWALPTVLRAAGHEVSGISRIIAALALPWTFKFLWAPIVDTWRSSWWGYRHWIIAAQLCMGAMLLPLAWLDVSSHATLLGVLLLAHAFCAATQDVAIDAWAISITPQAERGKLTGAMQTGMFTGRWLFGAGLLMVVDHVAPGAVIFSLVTVIWLTTLLVLINPYEVAVKVSGSGFITALVEVFAQWSTWRGIGFALLAGAGFEVLGGLAGPLLVDHGFSKAQAGAFFTATVVALIAGASTGGLLVDRIGHRRGAAWTLVALWVAIMLVAVSAAAHDLRPPPDITQILVLDAPQHMHPDPSAVRWLLVAALIATYLCIGAFVAASYAYFMDLTDPRLGGTQFSTFMGATNGCESWALFVGGAMIADRYDYPVVLVVMAGLSMVALLLLARTRPRDPVSLPSGAAGQRVL